MACPTSRADKLSRISVAVSDGVSGLPFCGILPSRRRPFCRLSYALTDARRVSRRWQAASTCRDSSIMTISAIHVHSAYSRTPRFFHTGVTRRHSRVREAHACAPIRRADFLATGCGEGVHKGKIRLSLNGGTSSRGCVRRGDVLLMAVPSPRHGYPRRLLSYMPRAAVQISSRRTVKGRHFYASRASRRRACNAIFRRTARLRRLLMSSATYMEAGSYATTRLPNPSRRLLLRAGLRHGRQ